MAYDTEFWVERYVQHCKRPTKHRAHGSPEVVLMGHLLTSLALKQLQASTVHVPHGKI